MRVRRRGAVAAVAVAVLLLAGVITLTVTLRQPAPVAVRSVRIPVVDGPRDNQRVLLDASFFAPSGQGRAPAILLSPGFGETKDAVRAQAEHLARAGFAVLTWSPRGIGASGGQIGLDSPDYEVKDTSLLVSWLARQPRVLLDRRGDPRVGIAGASYGGGLALLAAAYDHRIDAVVAQSAWNDLATALFPNGVFARQWAGLLFTQGSAGFGVPLPGAGGPGSPGSPAAAVRQHVLCGRFRPRICAMYQQIAQTGRATPGATALLLRSSPASVANRMDAPTLLIQGEHDSLFNLGQADANYRAIRRNGAPASVVWFAGGHDGGEQQPGYVDSLTAAWFTRWLGHAPASTGSGQPGFAVTRVLGIDPSTGGVTLGIAQAAAYPGLPGATRTVVRLTGPPQAIDHPPGGAPPSLSRLPRPRPPRRGRRRRRERCHLRHAGAKRRVHLRSADFRAPGHRVASGPHPGHRRGAGDAVRQALRRGPRGPRHPARSAGRPGAGQRRPGRAGGHRRAARHRLQLCRGPPGAARADHHRLRLRDPARSCGLPGGAGRARRRGARGPGADGDQRRSALVGLDGPAVGPGHRCADLDRGQARAGTTRSSRTSPRCRWRSPGWSSGTATASSRCTTCRSAWSAARCSGCSGRTAPARPPRCGC